AMSLKIRLLAGIALAALPAVASAQSFVPYVGLSGGWNQTRDADIDGVIDSEAEFDHGYAVSGSLGFRYDSNLRSELELSYRDNDIDSVRGFANSDGELNTLAIMANLYYDIGDWSGFVPYIGAGIGGARTDVEARAGANIVDDHDWNFAYQGIAGVGYAFNDNVMLTADYRYFATKDPELSTTAGSRFETENQNHTVMVGLRYSFGAPKAAPAPVTPVVAPPAPPPPAPPAPPPPAAAIPSAYVVFFDFDRADITAEAARIIAEAANAARTNSVTRIAVTGHADRSGTDRYNLALSQRRADAVRAELVRQGVTNDSITVAARGEAEPLVPTADGVREPQNRRVEIVFP
ncbi:MAG TPA: OmpA family protein, partial [Alphaproteobacteria bacterium]|nr:OmpA family protein [Alphaproteobacteria bacterium]